MVDEKDCDVGQPNLADEAPVEAGYTWIPPGVQPSHSPFASILRVLNCISRLHILLKGSVIETSDLRELDERFRSCLESFPPQHQIMVDDYLDPRTICPIIYLQNARIIMHRHNLSPICAPEVRSSAIDNCVLAARDTAKLLSRTMPLPLGSPLDSKAESESWRSNLVSATSAFLCTHVWRSTLFLCFRGEYQAALICARASSIMGRARPINNSCRQHLGFFLQCIINRMRRGERPPLEQDEEMIAYVSGDLQRGDRSWVWQGGDRGSPRDMIDFISSDASPAESKKEKNLDSGEWDNIMDTLRRLGEEQQQAQLPPFDPNLPRQQQQGDMTYLAPLDPVNHQAISPGGSNRISIANII